ncbi:radical SAM protein [Candidatus Kuenenbacteria bacterium]|nr:radical SAM protein [Candidatus Kuenenbacteria bacterium]
MSKINVNSNFHTLGGKSILDKDDEKFREYRRKWKECPENFQVPEFPLFIDIESTSVCNLKCVFCYNRERIGGGFIDEKIVHKIIDEGSKNGLCGVKFNFRGEPLLHPQIHEFVKYAKDKGLIDVYFNSHGLLLNEDMARKLIEAGLDRISISFEGHNKEVYEANRVGSNFETVVSNVKNLIRLRKELGVEHPKVRVQTVLIPSVVGHEQEYKDFWLDIGVDEVAYLDFKDMKDHHLGLEHDWACPQLWQRMAVLWDGTLIPCNHDDENEIKIGNVKDVSIKKQWNSEKLNKIRELHKQGQSHRVPGCNGCYLRDSEINKLK